ncbi:MAG TPA: UDP-N-acetylmuramoyl-L-alanine--D-glutamate ligase [Polyangiaceae bacterium]|jgi:UDP-N-acetylmuramoylalanine--D-glutamate ligase|nr:UDP-N-acetylmuramoyl-L-alanine--D-glutamate ligase [Polyangiaceae bacterium]
MSELAGKRVVVVGLGASGVAAARLCLRRGARVVANDGKPAGALSGDARALEAAGATLVAGGHAAARMGEADVIVVSPGVPPLPEIDAAARGGVAVWGEVELAVRSLTHPAPVVAIGGTNGKSTTTSLVGALLEAAGKRTFVGGNLGEPLADRADERFDVVVLEVSSFQMERVDRFRPHVAALLNVTDDHLDRYPSFDAYAHAKGNAFVRQTASDWAVAPAGDPTCAREARRGQGQLVTFGPGGEVDATGDAVVDRRSGERFARAEMALTGGHNALNVAASIACVTPFGVDAPTIRRVLGEFRGLPHRTALVAEIDRVRFYDDSKGTNVGAAVTALDGLVEPAAVLIAGGRDKGGSYAPLVGALARKGRAAVLLGESADAIAKAVGAAVPVRRAGSMDEAVRIAASLAAPGDAVLLSPACSSFDMFRDYKHRGDEFVRAVRALGALGPGARREGGAR